MAVCCWCGSALVQAEGAWWCGHASDACRLRQTAYATAHVDKKTKQATTWLYVPTPRQAEWHKAVYDRSRTRILVGGAAGPGKSRWLRETLYRLAREVPGFHALLLRKTHQDLNQSHLRFMAHEVVQRGGSYVKGPPAVATFPHKGGPESIIRAGHLEDSNAIENYLSSEYDAIAPDELVTFEREPMLELFTRARSTNPALFALRGVPSPEDPESELDGSLVVTATNPGGRGAVWVKDFFIDHTPEDVEEYDPQQWAFFDARLADNPYIKAGYRKTLANLSEARRRQLLEGDWNVFEGAFFSEFRAASHVRDLPLASGLEWFASMDWGFNAPGCVLWWACLPDGRYHIAREHKFKGDTAETVATMVKAITKDLGIAKLRYLACDPAMWQKTGAGKGESIAETLLRRGLPARRSDNDRFNGWLRCHELLRATVNEQPVEPWVTFAPACKYLIRTLPTMVQDKHDPDDLDTNKDDHAADAFRYGAMSRPSPTRIVKDESYPVGSWGHETARQDAQARQGEMVIA